MQHLRGLDRRIFSKAWYDRSAQMQSGYFYPWKSLIPPLNGEDTYTELVITHLTLTSMVLEVGCGHGADALVFGPRCRRLVAFDRVPAYLGIAIANLRHVGSDNIEFVLADSSEDVNPGQPRLSFTDASFDLVISR